MIKLASAARKHPSMDGKTAHSVAVPFTHEFRSAFIPGQRADEETCSVDAGYRWPEK
jgi:hypothetical protein